MATPVRSLSSKRVKTITSNTKFKIISNIQMYGGIRLKAFLNFPWIIPDFCDFIRACGDCSIEKHPASMNELYGFVGFCIKITKGSIG